MQRGLEANYTTSQRSFHPKAPVSPYSMFGSRARLGSRRRRRLLGWVLPLGLRGFRVRYDLRSRQLLGAGPDYLTVDPLPAAESGGGDDGRSRTLIHIMDALYVSYIRHIGNIRPVANVGYVHPA